MLFSQLILSLSAAGSLISALPSTKRSATYAVKERHPVPSVWKRIKPAFEQDTIHLSIGLKQQNEGVIENHLLEISDPSHHRYGKHLSHDEVLAIVSPTKDTLDQVQAWLEEHGISEYTQNSAKDMIHISVPIKVAEDLLQTKYHTYAHPDGSTVSRAPEWSLPEHLHEHIDLVQPTTSFFHPKREAEEDSNPWVPSSYWEEKNKPGMYDHSEHGSNPPLGSVSQICDQNFTTPECIRTLYGTIDYKPQVPHKNSIATTNYLNETAYRADIEQFLKTFRPDAVSAAKEFGYIQIANGINDQGPYSTTELRKGTNKEANLDVQQVLSISYPTRMLTYSTGGSPPFKPSISTPTDTNEPYLVWLDYVLSHGDLPKVVSTSYGDDEQSVPYSYAKRVCAGMAQLGARGTSVFFSSGDAGVGSDGTCYSNDGKKKYQFTPNFPTSCPWITSVGGTQGFEPEIAVSRFASGGGFSNYFPAPQYQIKTIGVYKKSLKGKFAGLYNKTGRGYPDVAAQGNHDTIVWAGNVSTIGGTSASSPTFAAVIALVNDALIAKGKPTLGFLNPWLYSGGYKALTDIVSGSSYGCNTTGFPATVGWDPVTGFGTPNFRKLVDAAMKNHGGYASGW